MTLVITDRQNRPPVASDWSRRVPTRGIRAEEHGPAGGRGGHRDGCVLIEPPAAFLPETGDNEQRVVDAERQAHAGHHVDDEDRQAELLRDDGGDPKADDDRHQGHEHRHESGHHRPEHEQQDDDGDRQPEVDLAVAQVTGGQCGEVIADRVSPGDRDGVPACAAGGPHAAHDGFDVCIIRRAQLDQGSVPPG
jgi:hypothetical protein